MAMKIPYDRLDLQIALIGLDEEKFTDEKFDQIKEEFKDKIPKEKSALNKLIAGHQGITIEQLINSPNYKVLREEYELSVCEQIVEKFEEKFEITEKQAWAIMAGALGWLEI